MGQVILDIIRTFGKYTHNTLDLSAVPIITEKTYLPVIVDPSSATGWANLMETHGDRRCRRRVPTALVEVHYDPRRMERRRAVP